jgi:hypothetical protein
MHRMHRIGSHCGAGKRRSWRTFADASAQPLSEAGNGAADPAGRTPEPFPKRAVVPVRQAVSVLMLGRGRW